MGANELPVVDVEYVLERQGPIGNVLCPVLPPDKLRSHYRILITCNTIASVVKRNGTGGGGFKD